MPSLVAVTMELSSFPQVRRDLSSYDTQQPYQHAISNAAVASEDPRCVS